MLQNRRRSVIIAINAKSTCEVNDKSGRDYFISETEERGLVHIRLCIATREAPPGPVAVLAIPDMK